MPSWRDHTAHASAQPTPWPLPWCSTPSLTSKSENPTNAARLAPRIACNTRCSAAPESPSRVATKWPSDPEATARAGRAAQAAPASTIAAELLAFADAPDLRPRLGEVRCPVYLRTGELDLPTPPSHARSIVAGLADARLGIVPGAGHLVQVEDYPGVLASVRAALVAAAPRG